MAWNILIVDDSPVMRSFIRRVIDLAAIEEAFEVAARETPPPPLSEKLAARCPPCSLLPLCLPEEVRLLRSKKNK